MGKLKDLLDKGVRLIVTESPSGEMPAEGEAEAPRKPREIPPEAFDVPERAAAPTSSVPAGVEDFGAVYQEAGIELPLHGYGIEKVMEMLESKRLGSLDREVKATAVMAALEAAQVPLKDVIQDAVLRDNALDAFESAKEKELQELRAKNEARIESLKGEMEELLKKINVEIETLKRESEAAGKAFDKLQERKRLEETRLHDVVSHFVEGLDNPITKGPRASGGAASKPEPA
jgi:hypothetical protein